MKGSTEIMKGRIEEAAGALTGNDKLRVKGRMDQAMGKVGQAAENGVRQAKESARRIVDKARNIAQEAVATAKRRVLANSGVKESRMKATETLKHEHQAMLLVIVAVEKEVASIEKTGTIHAQTVREMADFFKNFGDRCHQAKEEKHLFTMLHERGISTEIGPLDVMLHEHEQGRACVRAVAEAVEGETVPDAAAIRKAKENLAAYAQLLRAHIDKEDNIIFPMADRLLKSAADQKTLAQAFDKVESEEMGEGVHAKYHAWIEQLVGRH